MCSSAKSSGRPTRSTGSTSTNHSTLSADALNRFSERANASDERRQKRKEEHHAQKYRVLQF